MHVLGWFYTCFYIPWNSSVSLQAWCAVFGGFLCARVLYIGQECNPGIQSLPVQPQDKLARTDLSMGKNESSPMDTAFKECVFSSDLKSEFSKPCGPDMEPCFRRQIQSAFLLHRSR